MLTVLHFCVTSVVVENYNYDLLKTLKVLEFGFQERVELRGVHYLQTFVFWWQICFYFAPIDRCKQHAVWRDGRFIASIAALEQVSLKHSRSSRKAFSVTKLCSRLLEMQPRPLRAVLLISLWMPAESNRDFLLLFSVYVNCTYVLDLPVNSVMIHYSYLVYVSIHVVFEILSENLPANHDLCLYC